MPGRQQICILCRNICYPARRLSHGGRAASQLRSLEPYDASKLVLDLDATDCKFVRRYEDEPGAINAHKFKSSNKPKPESIPEKQYQPYRIADVYRPNPVDFLTYSFWTDGLGPTSPSRMIFGHVASLCLRHGVGSYEERIKWLFGYEALPYKLDRIHTHPNRTDRQIQMDIRGIFRGCKTLYHARRVTALLTRNLDGCKFVAKYATFILQTVGLEVPQAPKKRRAGLMYINSVIQRLESMGVDPGPGWFGAGMYHAARVFNFPAMKKYIDTALSKDDSCEKIDNTHIRTTLEFLFDFHVNQKVLAKINSSDPVASLKPDILRILTGWDRKGVPQKGEIQNNCFAMLLRDDESISRLYFKILIRFKANSALRYELSHGLLAKIPDDLDRGDSPTVLWRTDLKARVLVHIGEPLQALELLLSRKKILEDRISSQVERPATMTHLIPGRRTLRRNLIIALAKKYEMLPVFDIDERRLSEDLKGLSLYTPETMSMILHMLSRYWPPYCDDRIRKMICFEGPSALVCLNALQAVNRRLITIEEFDGEQYDDDGRINERKDVERLGQLQADLQSLSFWTEAEDNILKNLVRESWPGDVRGKEAGDWEFMADKLVESVPDLIIPKTDFMSEFLKQRYGKLKRTEGGGIGMAKVNVLSQIDDSDEVDEAGSIGVLNKDDASRTLGRH